MTLSTALRNGASHLRTERSELHFRFIDSHHDWLSLSLGGPAGDAARTSLAVYTDWLAPSLHQMEHVAATLDRHANLQARREELEDRIIAFLGQIDERNVAAARAAGLLLNQVRALGDSLDWLCSQEIDALCTPAGVSPPVRFEEFSDLPVDTIHEINLAQANEHVAQLAAKNPDMKVLEASDGRLVAMVDPGEFRTTPASLTTFIEGVHSSDPETWQRAVDRGRNLAKASGGPAVVWLGYQAPSSLPRAVHADPARTAGSELVRFQRALGARYPQAKRTVVGYSYGSVVTGHAAKEDKIADDVVLVGSPGAGASHSSELHGRIWAATNAHDPIAIATGPHGGIHGPDPTTDAFGATPLPGADGLPGDHGTYWEDPRFLRGLGQVARAH
ncbi:alpha/beta hydrolase family protein [Corynebacterium kefirresidentii]|uniref:alpha/beta hydrolase n=1 Tax=Corynebacterium TaxID=1716 RepID=UPI001EF3606F|nr:alpha/beta hydrolase [Corynebacterium kefirresidentii]MCG7451056.1 alpha/beta hydrolase family protein [Corynebacterium kefirresidentii]MCG7452995.1 alpha/beta hydrolase family protein [Corynebacterium kefirresidentii]